MKQIALLIIVLAGIFMTAGCLTSGGSERVPVTQVPPAVTTVATPVATPVAVAAAHGVSGKVYCYSGTYLGGCVGFSPEGDYLESITDMSGAAGYKEAVGDDTVAKYGRWISVSPTEVRVATTYNMYDSFRGIYDGTATWRCVTSECNTVYEPQYEFMYTFADVWEGYDE